VKALENTKETFRYGIEDYAELLSEAKERATH